MEETVTGAVTNLPEHAKPEHDQPEHDKQDEVNVLDSNTTAIVKVNDSGQIVIPAAYLQALGVTAGDGFVVRYHNEQLQLIPHKQALREAQTLVREHVPEGISLVEELIADRRNAAE